MAPRILHKSKQTTLERADLGHNWLAAGADDGEKASKKAAKISKIEPKMEIHYSRIFAAIYFHFCYPPATGSAVIGRGSPMLSAVATARGSQIEWSVDIEANVYWFGTFASANLVFFFAKCRVLQRFQFDLVFLFVKFSVS